MFPGLAFIAFVKDLAMQSDQSIALISGAGRETGIGFEVAAQLAATGMNVILTARDKTAAIERATQLNSKGWNVIAKQMDVSDPQSIAATVAEVSKSFGKLDILINNAASIGPFGELAATADLAKARDIYEVVVYGTWRTTQAFLPLLHKSNHPRIVNVSSGAGSHGDTAFGLTTGNSMGTSYAVAKAALNALTVKFANEEKANGVLVNAVCPGFTATFAGGAAMGARPVHDGAASIVWGALIPDDGPTGEFFRDGKPLAW
jgi:NAD(P)-dependent dehydrogenase (short-subunit alcohol dehydrogenase family)